MKEDPDADADADADGEPDADADAEGEYLDEEGSEDVKPITGHGTTNGKRRMSLSAAGSAGMGRSSANPRRPQWSSNGNGYGPVDLDSVGGRKQFIASSIYHLFSTTFTPSEDELTISALLAYLNAAMPQDKFEDFDTTEVARAVAGLKERGRVLFEGDGIRLVE
ncbi:hypothetical protein NLJ89_g8000 [Agrocybe chaxingu]|uniref:Uncharacterized protein n=1 Tax=Agrocybe chaxingu TaxID=84603 RepID=A0A9W8MUI2_9AGAR|nr:hypothetical protein NLJ89_g8000 [Agrocybe chaxingu]